MFALWWRKLPASNYPGNCFQRGNTEQGGITPLRAIQEVGNNTGTSCLAAQNNRLALLLLCRLVIPKSSILGPAGVKESQIIFLKVDSQGEYGGEVYSKHKVAYMLISHLYFITKAVVTF